MPQPKVVGKQLLGRELGSRHHHRASHGHPGREGKCSPGQVGGVEVRPRDKQVLVVEKEGSPGRGFSFGIGPRYVTALRSGRIRCPGVGVKSSQLSCCVSYQQVWM